MRRKPGVAGLIREKEQQSALNAVGEKLEERRFWEGGGSPRWFSVGNIVVMIFILMVGSCFECWSRLTRWRTRELSVLTSHWLVTSPDFFVGDVGGFSLLRGVCYHYPCSKVHRYFMLKYFCCRPFIHFCLTTFLAFLALDAGAGGEKSECKAVVAKSSDFSPGLCLETSQSCLGCSG